MTRRPTRNYLSPQGTRAALLAALLPGNLSAQDQPKDGTPVTPAESAGSGAEETIEEKPFYIRQYRVKGAKELPPVEVERAVYPFMGPECTTGHIEQARQALEKAYRDKGYLLPVTVSFAPGQEVPPKHGIVKFEVIEGRVGRLRVKGSRYFSLEKIKARAPSLAEGGMPKLEDVKREILALNRHPDRQVSPSSARQGLEPGIYHVDLTVKDTLPLHGSLELNNRNSPDTTDLRLNGAISYGNLWQAGHTLGLAFQIAPERLEDAKVFSAYYTVPVPRVDGLSLTFNGIKQDSDVNTLGGAGVVGRGYMLGARASLVLPPGLENTWFHSVSGGFDFKHFDQNVTVGETDLSTPIDYFPFTVTYGGTHVAKTHSTDANASLVFHFRGLGSGADEFDAKRFKADAAFVYLRADASHTHDLRNGMQLFGKVQGQLSSGPLVDSEQFSGGGLSNVRGYLESTVLGDNAITGSVEVRTPSLIPIALKEGETRPSRPNEWRFYAFCDAGHLSNYDPLPEQDASFVLASVGVGSRFRVRDHFNGSVDAAFPLTSEGTTDSDDVVVTFRMWSDF